MRGHRARLSAFVAAAALIFPATAQASDNGPPTCGSLRSLLARSTVPVLLPAPLPRGFGSVASVAVITAGRDGYYVGFSAVPQCDGAMSCALLHVAGYSRVSEAGRGYGTDRPVRLPDGSRGFFSPRNCSGASCTEASLTFERNHAIYEIDAKVAEGDLALLTSVYRTLQPVASLPTRCHGR